MNKSLYIGRLTRDPEVRYVQNGSNTTVAKYTLAIDRPRFKDKENEADFIPCVAFGKLGEFAEKYLTKGMKILVEGHMQSGSYTNKDGQKVYTLECIVEKHEFVESKSSGSSSASGSAPKSTASDDGFMNIPQGIDEELPFN